MIKADMKVMGRECRLLLHDTGPLLASLQWPDRLDLTFSWNSRRYKVTRKVTFSKLPYIPVHYGWGWDSWEMERDLCTPHSDYGWVDSLDEVPDPYKGMLVYLIDDVLVPRGYL